MQYRQRLPMFDANTLLFFGIAGANTATNLFSLALRHSATKSLFLAGDNKATTTAKATIMAKATITVRWDDNGKVNDNEMINDSGNEAIYKFPALLLPQLYKFTGRLRIEPPT